MPIVTFESLYEEYKKLIADYKELEEKLKHRDRYNEHLEEALRLLRHRGFAPSSEKLGSSEDTDEQLSIFNEIEELAASHPEDAIEPEQQDLVEVAAHKKKKPKRKPLPKELPREEVVIDLPDQDKKCPQDGTDLKVMGEQTSERLDVIPMQMKVIVTRRLTYACPCCERFIKTAPVEPSIVPKGLPTAGTLAFIATAKFCDALSLYHIEKMFGRNGVEGITRASQAHWMIRSASLAQPLINLLEEELLDSSYAQMDETTLQVLKEPGKKPQTKSYMWLRCRPTLQRPIVLFEYDPTRSAKVAERLMQDFKGDVQCDGYEGYGILESKPGVDRYGCMAHVRRKFYEAQKSSKNSHIAKHTLKLIGRLYKVEDEVEGKPPDEVLKIREEKSKPLLDELEKWKDAHLHRVPPKSTTGKALMYMHNEWPYVSKYAQSGAVRIDNNYIENMIRPFAVGRKRWLFSDSVEGAKASAVLYSLVETAKANGLEPYWYLRKLFEQLPRAQTVDDFEKLLPWSMKKNKS